MTGDIHPSSTHPPLPPTTEDERFFHLRLLRSRRVGPTTYHRLLAEHGSARAALDALPEVARAAGVDRYSLCPEQIVDRELAAGVRAGARLLIHGQQDYPAPLTELTDAPPILWAVGDLDVLQRPALAVVGARNASALGTRMAKSLVQELGQNGYVIVSGLARGIDTAAHLAALSTGTIAVQAGGVDVMYPAENTSLAGNIAEKGLRVSEQPFGLQPQARHFPARNRIIAGLAKACIVVEAAAKSGSLITARDASDLGRDILAVPGHPFDARAAGCNILIREGATLVRRAEDVIEAISPFVTPAIEKLSQGDPVLPLQAPPTGKTAQPAKPEADTAALHQLILSRLSTTPIAEDELVRALQKSSEHIAPALVDLELNGDIQRHIGGFLSRQS
ncbi:MAG: DNA-processing protein DprA [Pseudomonadota bacterium]